MGEMMVSTGRWQIIRLILPLIWVLQVDGSARWQPIGTRRAKHFNEPSEVLNDCLDDQYDQHLRVIRTVSDEAT